MTFPKVTTTLTVGLLGFAACNKEPVNLASREDHEVRAKLESFERGELTLEEVTSTEPGGADAAWVHRLVAYYVPHSNAMTIKMKLPISRCYAVMEEYPTALKLAQEYVNVYSNDWHAWRIVGSVNYFMKNLDAAVSAYTNAVRLGDEGGYAKLALAAMETDQDNLVRDVLPRLFVLKDTRATEDTDRIELVTVLIMYALRNDREEVFVKAVEGLSPEGIVAREGLTSLVKQGCERFKTKETEDLYRKIVGSEKPGGIR